MKVFYTLEEVQKVTFIEKIVLEYSQTSEYTVAVMAVSSVQRVDEITLHPIQQATKTCRRILSVAA